MAETLRQPDAEQSVANRQRAWILFFIIAIIDLIPYAVVFIAAPAPSRTLDEMMNLAMCGWQCLLAAVIGAIGGRLKQWRMTLAGTFFMVAVTVVVVYVVEWLRRFPADTASPLLMLIPLTLGYVLMLIPACGAHAMVALHRQKETIGRCQVCDYNLTGNVSGKCPECGTPIVDDKVLS